MTNKQHALQYLKKGLSVIPLISPSMVSGNFTQKEINGRCKRALVKWEKFQEQVPTEDEVNTWWDKWPDANIGIVTGKVSNLIVFDIDKEDATEYAKEEGGFPSMTVKAISGKGYHIYVQCPDFKVVNNANTDLGLDIRGDGGYIVAPPSMHGTGKQYAWETGFSIHDIDPAPPEVWMEFYLKEHATKTGQEAKKALKPSKKSHKTVNPSVDDQYFDIAKNGSQQGNRNHIATKYIGHLLGKGNDEAVAWEMIKLWNAGKNNPPLDENELLKTFNSIRDLNQKNAPHEKKREKIEISDLLDTAEKVTAEHDQEYIRIPIAHGDQLKNMQSKMNGGLSGGRTYVIGGMPTASKTTLMNNLGDNICLNGHPVLFFSYDDGRTELRYRTYSRFSGFDIEEFNQHNVSKTDIEAIYHNDKISAISILKYVVEQNIKISDWSKIIDQIIDRHKKAPVIMVDYLRKVKTEGNRLDERLRVDEILSNLTDMAKKYNLPILVISELSRESYKTGQRLGMTAFKESGNIEYEASWLGILAAVKDDGKGYQIKNNWERIINHDGNIDLIVSKAKRGTGATGRIPLKLDKNKMNIRDRIEATKNDGVTLLKRKSRFGQGGSEHDFKTIS